MNEREYLRLKADAETEYRRKLEAIETVWRMSGGEYSKGWKPTPSLNGDGLAKGTLQEAARAAIRLLSGDFTLRDVFTAIAKNDPILAGKLEDKMPSLSGALKRMADEKELVLVEAGKGKRPSKYRRPG